MMLDEIETKSPEDNFLKEASIDSRSEGSSVVDTNVLVVCRLRPQNRRENRKGGKTTVQLDRHDAERIVLVDPEDADNKYEFRFDQVFGMTSTQDDIYNYVGAPIVSAVTRGYNGTIFAYGQTGSGKTFTMEGPSLADDERCGIISRMTHALFEQIEKAPKHIKYTVSVSMLEIYMERVNDLLDPSKLNLAIREDTQRGIWVEGCRTEYLRSADAILEVVKRGQQNRSTASTKMNSDSSRSHSLVVINVLQQDLHEHSQVSGRMTLVDLAGSEKVRKSGSTGARLEEAKTINKSLSTLGNVINALTDSSMSYTPYRDSKLTRILQESLGGNSRTALILCASPSSIQFSETMSTLRFGARAKLVRNEARVNQVYSAAELRALLTQAQKELATLRAQATRTITPINNNSINSETQTQSSNSGNTTPRQKIMNLIADADQRRLQAQINELEDALLNSRAEASKQSILASELKLKLRDFTHEMEQQRLDYEAKLAKEGATRAEACCREEELQRDATAQNEEILRLRDEVDHLEERLAKRDAQAKVAERKLREKETDLRRERDSADNYRKELEKLNLELVRVVEARTDAARQHQEESESLRRASERASKDHTLSFKLISNHFEETREELRSSQGRIKELEKELSAKHAEVSDLRSQFETHESNSQKQAFNASEAEAKILHLQEELLRATCSQRLLRKTLDQVKVDTESHRIELENKIGQLQRARSELEEETQLTRDMFKHNLADGAGRVSQLLDELDQAQHALVSSASAAASTEARLKTAIGSLTSELSSSKSEVEACRREIAQKQENIQELSTHSESQSKKIAQLQEKLTTVQRECVESENHTRNLQLEMKNLRDMEKKYVDKIEKLQLTLRNARKLCFEHAQREIQLKDKLASGQQLDTSKIEKLQEELEAVQKKCREYAQTVKALEGEVDRLRAVGQENTRRIRELDTALVREQNTCREYESELRGLRQEISRFQKLKPELEQELKYTQKERNEYAASTKTLQNEVQKLSALEEKRSVQILVLEKKLVDSNERSREHAEKAKRMQLEMGQLLAQKDDTADQIKRLHEQLGELKQRNGQQGEKAKALKDEVDRLRISDRENNTRIQHLETSLQQERELSKQHKTKGSELQREISALENSRVKQVADLQRQLDDTVKEQRQHADQVRTLEADVRQLRLRESQHASQFKELEATLARERQLSREYKDKEVNLHEELAKLQKKQESQLSELRVQLGQARSEHHDSAAKIKSLEKQLSALHMRDDENLTQIRHLEASLEEERHLATRHERNASSLQVDLESLERKQASDVSALRDELSSVKMQLREKESTAQQLEEQVQKLQLHGSGNASKIRALEEHLQKEQSASENFQRKALDLQDQLAVLQEKHASLISNFQAARNQNQEQEGYVKSLELEMADLKARSTSDATELQQMREQLQKKEQDLNGQVKSLLKENSELAASLQAAKKRNGDQAQAIDALQGEVEERRRADGEKYGQLREMQASLESAHQLNRDYADKLVEVGQKVNQQNDFHTQQYNQILELQQSLAKAQELNKEYCVKLDSLGSDYSTQQEAQEKEIARLQQELRGLEYDCRAQVERARSLDVQVKEMTSRYDDVHEQNRSLQSSLSESQRLCNEYAGRETNLQQEMRKVDAEKSMLIKELEQKLLHTQHELSHVQAEMNTISKQAQIDLAALGTAEAAKMATVLCESQNVTQRYKDHIESIKEELHKSKEMNRNLEIEIMTLKQEHLRENEENAATLQKYVDALADADSENLSAHERISKLKADLESAVNNCAVAQAARDAEAHKRVASVQELQESQQHKLVDVTRALHDEIKHLQGEKAVLEAQVWERNEHVKAKARAIQTSLLSEIKVLEKPCADLLGAVNKFVSSVKSKENTIADIKRQCSKSGAMEDSQRERYDHIVASLNKSLEQQHEICEKATTDVNSFKTQSEELAMGIRLRLISIRDEHYSAVSEASRRLDRVVQELVAAEQRASLPNGRKDSHLAQDILQLKEDKLQAEEHLINCKQTLESALDKTSVEFHQKISTLRQEEEAARRDLHEKLQLANRCQSELIQSLASFEVKDMEDDAQHDNGDIQEVESLRDEVEHLRQLVELQEAKIERRNRRIEAYEERILRIHEGKVSTNSSHAQAQAQSQGQSQGLMQGQTNSYDQGIPLNYVDQQGPLSPQRGTGHYHLQRQPGQSVADLRRPSDASSVGSHSSTLEEESKASSPRARRQGKESQLRSRVSRLLGGGRDHKAHHAHNSQQQQYQQHQHQQHSNGSTSGHEETTNSSGSSSRFNLFLNSYDLHNRGKR